MDFYINQIGVDIDAPIALLQETGQRADELEAQFSRLLMQALSQLSFDEEDEYAMVDHTMLLPDLAIELPDLDWQAFALDPESYFDVEVIPYLKAELSRQLQLYLSALSINKPLADVDVVHYVWLAIKKALLQRQGLFQQLKHQQELPTQLLRCLAQDSNIRQEFIQLMDWPVFATRLSQRLDDNGYVLARAFSHLIGVNALEPRLENLFSTLTQSARQRLWQGLIRLHGARPLNHTQRLTAIHNLTSGYELHASAGVLNQETLARVEQVLYQNKAGSKLNLWFELCDSPLMTQDRLEGLNQILDKALNTNRATSTATGSTVARFASKPNLDGQSADHTDVDNVSGRGFSGVELSKRALHRLIYQLRTLLNSDQLPSGLQQLWQQLTLKTEDYGRLPLNIRHALQTLLTKSPWQTPETDTPDAVRSLEEQLVQLGAHVDAKPLTPTSEIIAELKTLSATMTMLAVVPLVLNTRLKRLIQTLIADAGNADITIVKPWLTESLIWTETWLQRHARRSEAVKRQAITMPDPDAPTRRGKPAAVQADDTPSSPMAVWFEQTIARLKTALEAYKAEPDNTVAESHVRQQVIALLPIMSDSLRQAAERLIKQLNEENVEKLFTQLTAPRLTLATQQIGSLITLSEIDDPAPTALDIAYDVERNLVRRLKKVFEMYRHQVTPLSISAATMHSSAKEGAFFWPEQCQTITRFIADIEQQFIHTQQHQPDYQLIWQQLQTWSAELVTLALPLAVAIDEPEQRIWFKAYQQLIAECQAVSDVITQSSDTWVVSQRQQTFWWQPVLQVWQQQLQELSPDTSAAQIANGGVEPDASVPSVHARLQAVIAQQQPERLFWAQSGDDVKQLIESMTDTPARQAVIPTESPSEPVAESPERHDDVSTATPVGRAFVPDESTVKAMKASAQYLDDYQQAVTAQLEAVGTKQLLQDAEQKLGQMAQSQQGLNDDLISEEGGLVVVWPFLAPMFNRLSLITTEVDEETDEKRTVFVDEAAQLKAHQLLCAMVDLDPEESASCVINVLLGLPPDTQVEPIDELTEDELTEVDGMLTAAITRWEALQGMPVATFKELFLKRQAEVLFGQNGFIIQVQEKAQDILLTKLPWGVGMIQLPWLDKSLIQVNWKYGF